MADVLTMQRKAREIADQASARTRLSEDDERAQQIADTALRTQRGGEAQRALMEGCMQAIVSAGLEAQRTRNGRELAVFEKDFARVAVLIDALLEGNYRETAARLAGVAESGVRAWLKAADDGDGRYQPIALAIRAAESIAEAECVRVVRNAGKADPRYWAAAATWLERKFPDRYGRRAPESSGNGVTVVIGVGAERVQLGLHVQLAEPTAAAAPDDAGALLNPADVGT